MSMQADPYIGEIRMFAGNFAPDGWAMCDGQSLPINENEILYALIGEEFGATPTSFNLPDLRGRAPIHQSASYPLAQPGGAESFTMSVAQLPSHNHLVLASTAVGDSPDPTGRFFANTGAGDFEYSTLAPNTTMNANAIGFTGGSEPVAMWQPSLAINYIIALSGVYPTQS